MKVVTVMVIKMRPTVPVCNGYSNMRQQLYGNSNAGNGNDSEMTIVLVVVMLVVMVIIMEQQLYW